MTVMDAEDNERNEETAEPATGEAPPGATPENAAEEAEDIGTPEHVGDGGLKDQVIDALRTIFDPEIPVNIHALGLIYGVKLDDAGACKITMTLTSPNCPAAQSLPAEIETKARAVPGVTGVDLSIVWDPPWGMEKMTPEARLTLGL